MPLPTFRYHPDPVATGSVVPSDAECVCCGQVRGFIYVGPVYALDEYDEMICPWCIADGSAHEKLDASFTDEDGVGGGEWDEVPNDVVEEVAYRTPGFKGWQQERWWTHCGDAAQFIGPAGHAEVAAHGPGAVSAMRESSGLPEGPEWQELFAGLERDGSPTAYLFRCVNCQQIGGYLDFD